VAYGHSVEVENTGWHCLSKYQRVFSFDDGTYVMVCLHLASDCLCDVDCVFKLVSSTLISSASVEWNRHKIAVGL